MFCGSRAGMLARLPHNSSARLRSIKGTGLEPLHRLGIAASLLHYCDVKQPVDIDSELDNRLARSKL